MEQVRNKIIKLLAVVTLLVALLATVTTVATVNATANEADYTLVMNGAEIRPDENYGIRYIATANAVRQDSKYYMMIVPESWLTDTEHDLQNAANGDYYQHLIGKGLEVGVDFITMQSMPEQKGDVYEVKGTISKVRFTNSNVKFFGIAYEELADGTRSYAISQDKSVRSIAWVAGAALNDESAELDETMKTKLKDTIGDAYDVSLGNTEDTGAVLDLSSCGFKQTGGYYTLDKGSVTPLEMVGLPDIDLPIEYSVSAGSGIPSTITQDGVLTVNDETGYSYVYAQIAGEKKLLTVRNTPEMAEGMLNDFAVGSDNNTRTYDMNVYGTDVTGGRGGWLNEKADAYGNKGYGVGSVAKGGEASGLRLNVSKAELKAMDIETITVRFLIEVADASVKNLSLNFFWIPEISNPGNIYLSYPVNTWSYYTINKPTGDAWETFIDTYCNNGVGRSAWNKGGFTVYSGTPTLYIDYISVGTQRMAEHELENFDTANSRYNCSNDYWNINNNPSTHHATYTDGAGTTAYGVVSAQIYYSMGSITTRFGRTEAELLKIMKNLDTLTVRVLITRDVSDTEYRIRLFGIYYNQIPTNTWANITVTRDEILAVMTGETEEAKIAQFVSKYCSTGSATEPWMIGAACNGISVNVYLDSITYTVRTAEAE